MQQGFWHGALYTTDRMTVMSGKSCVARCVRVTSKRVGLARCSLRSSSEEPRAYQIAQAGDKLHTLAWCCHSELDRHS
jgi:hypothetical protein